MSNKREIKEFLEEGLSRGYSKEQVKRSILRKGKYSEKEVMKILIEHPEKSVFEAYKGFHLWLIVFFTLSILIKAYFAYVDNISLGLGIGWSYLIASLLLPAIFLIGLFKKRAWSYVLIFITALLNLIYSAYEVIIALFGEIPVEYASIPGIRTEAIILSLSTFILYLLITTFSRYCWKKIHPDYKIKNLFTV